MMQLSPRVAASCPLYPAESAELSKRIRRLIRAVRKQPEALCKTY